VLESLSAILKYGYQSLYLLLLMEAIGLPVPGAIVLLAAGAAAATGVLRPGPSLLVAVSAMLTGDILLYLVGRKTGWTLLNMLCRLSVEPETCIMRSAESFYQRGRAALLVTKFLPGINTMAAPLSGSMGMQPLTFLSLDLCGAVLYTSAYWFPGFLFSELLKKIVSGMQAFSTGLERVILLSLAIYIAYRLFHASRQRKLGVAPKVQGSALWALVNAPNPPPLMIADVRSHGYYDRGALRIKGSVRLDPNRLPALLPTLPKEEKIYLYCT
jgi:membrane protein DedA with SNARE-associated domain